MTTNELIGGGGVPFMQRTKTWLILYALGLTVLVLSLWRSEAGKPAEPRVPATVVQGAAAPHPVP